MPGDQHVANAKSFYLRDFVLQLLGYSNNQVSAISFSGLEGAKKTLLLSAYGTLKRKVQNSDSKVFNFTLYKQYPAKLLAHVRSLTRRFSNRLKAEAENDQSFLDHAMLYFYFVKLFQLKTLNKDSIGKDIDDLMKCLKKLDPEPTRTLALIARLFNIEKSIIEPCGVQCFATSKASSYAIQFDFDLGYEDLDNRLYASIGPLLSLQNQLVDGKKSKFSELEFLISTTNVPLKVNITKLQSFYTIAKANPYTCDITLNIVQSLLTLYIALFFDTKLRFETSSWLYFITATLLSSLSDQLKEASNPAGDHIKLIFPQTISQLSALVDYAKQFFVHSRFRSSDDNNGTVAISQKDSNEFNLQSIMNRQTTKKKLVDSNRSDCEPLAECVQCTLGMKSSKSKRGSGHTAKTVTSLKNSATAQPRVEKHKSLLGQIYSECENSAVYDSRTISKTLETFFDFAARPILPTLPLFEAS